MVTSRLADHELWIRLHALGLGAACGAAARDLLGRLAFLELVPPVLARAREPFPRAVRTLEALHLSSALFLREQRPELAFATYDARMAAAARAVGLRVVEP